MNAVDHLAVDHLAVIPTTLCTHTVCVDHACGFDGVATSQHPQGAAPAADDAKLRSHASTAMNRALTLLDVPVHQSDALLQRQLQTMIRELVNVKGGRNKLDKSGKHATAQLLCACADAAGAVAKWGRPRDLQGVAALVNAGVYARWPGGAGLQAFTADVHAVCDLWRAALKRSQSEFATAMLESGGGPLADAVAARLTKLLAGGGLVDEHVVDQGGV